MDPITIELDNAAARDLETAISLHLLEIRHELVRTDDREYRKSLRRTLEVLEGIDHRFQSLLRPATAQPGLVGDVMTREVAWIGPDDTTQSAAQRMREANVGILPVCQYGRVVGVVTDRDITTRITGRGFDARNTHVDEAMTREVVSTTSDRPLAQAAQLMAEKAVRRLIVLNADGTLAGVLSRDDVARTARGNGG
jgi:CBS domain-containing protein